jgi:peptidoglycan/xylan/chitin deacetylase (PgdA/CDA1 family)
LQLHHIKHAIQRAAVATGLAGAVAGSSWRHRRLVILCYHGIALEDEHLWNPGMYMSPELFTSRMLLLRKTGCTVLPLGEALERLHEGTLPPCSVVITFDDGFVDFGQAAFPVLRRGHVPATVYLTTYYSDFQRPVFDLMLGYLLWKARERTLEWPELFGSLPLRLNDGNRAAAELEIRQRAKQNQWSGQAKDEILTQLASRLRLDYAHILRRRLLHIMTREEAGDLARQGVQFQLHTHRHRTSRNREWFEREINQNRERLAEFSATQHFCYPGGVHFPEYPEWLRNLGVMSATTCQPGIVAPRTDRMRLPRYLDSTTIPEAVYESWITGFAALLPQKHYPMGQDQLLEDWLIGEPWKPAV